jgi:hypothetical protein
MAADPLLPSPGWLFGNCVSWKGLTEETAKGKVSVQKKTERKTHSANEHYKNRRKKMSLIKSYSRESISKIDFGY